jgi:two-component system sensor histidine kinase/response regulator
VEEALAESERKYRELVENANSIIIKWDKKGNITFFNEFAQRFFGYTHDEIIGKPVMDTIFPAFESGSNRDISLMIDDILRHPEDHILNENENITRDGKRVWIQWHNKRLLDEKGDFIGLFSIGTDITERRHTEEALRESEEKFRSLVEYALEGILIVDFQGNILFANNAAAQLVESDGCAGLIGRNVMEFIAPGSREDVMRDFIQVSQGHDGYLAQYTAISVKGNKFSVECIGKVISYEGKPADLISIRDISGRNRVY